MMQKRTGRIAWCSIWRYVWRLDLYQSGMRKKYLAKNWNNRLKRVQRWQKEPSEVPVWRRFWKQFGYRIAHIEVENEGILVKVTSAQEYEERRQIFAEKQIRGHVKVSLAVNRSFLDRVL